MKYGLNTQRQRVMSSKYWIFSDQHSEDVKLKDHRNLENLQSRGRARQWSGVALSPEPKMKLVGGRGSSHILIGVKK